MEIDEALGACEGTATSVDLQALATLRQQQANADLAVYIAGADPFQEDRLGRLKMTKPGLAQRDRFVFDACRQAGLPAVVVMGGGYARDVQDVVDIHAETIRLAALYAAREPG